MLKDLAGSEGKGRRKGETEEKEMWSVKEVAKDDGVQIRQVAWWDDESILLLQKNGSLVILGVCVSLSPSPS